MDEVKQEEKPMTKSDYEWLSRRIDSLQERMFEENQNLRRKLRLLVRIMVDKKIIGAELAKSVEESFASDDEAANDKLEWLLKSLEEEK